MPDLLELRREELHDVLLDDDLGLDETDIAKFEAIWWHQVCFV